MRTGQLSLDDLGTPLSAVTFCVVDLETTGSDAATDGITEIGMVKLRGGECLGTLHTLVNPGLAIPPAVTMLTGITEAMVFPAPRIEAVLPAVVEFAAGCVLVGHNVGFDVAFLNRALARAGWPTIGQRVVDTLPLARRLVRDEVPNCRLRTLADRFRLDHRPTHRALDDALATADLLHLLLERAGTLGVLGLDDLLALPRLEAHPQAAKLRLTAALPRRPGVYLFLGGHGEVLYVGKATNLRTRVRSYFCGDERRKVGSLLREVQAVRAIECAHPLEAAVTEVRLIHHHQPRYNAQIKRWRGYAYVKLTLEEAFPRLAVVTAPRADGGVYLGPLPSRRTAVAVVEAVHTASPLRRCTIRLGRAGGGRARASPCTPAQLGVALCPCSGGVGADQYAAVVTAVARGLTVEPRLLLDPLADRMGALARAQRYEEAADVRDRAAALAGALRRQRRFDGLRAAGRVRLALPDGGGAELHHGVLVAAWGSGVVPGSTAVGREAGGVPPGQGVPTTRRLPIGAGLPVDNARGPIPAGSPAAGPLPRHLADELTCVAAWLDAEAGRLRVLHSDGPLASPVPALPSFCPAPVASIE